MARPATPIQLLDEERTTLEKWVRSHKTEQRKVLRSNIILMADDGLTTEEILKKIGGATINSQ